MSVPVVVTSGLTVRFGAHVVLEDITFEAGTGDFVAIVGPNGAGKTTLLRVLLGLVEPTDGRVRVRGQTPPASDSGLIGYVPQVKTLDRTFPARAIDLVLTALRQRWPFRVTDEERERATAVLDQVGGRALAERSLGELSGGELQRVYLARSLVRKPKLILLDEPATGIDVTGTSDFYEVLEEDQAARGTTVLMVTHDWNAAYHHASHVLLIDRTQVSYGPSSSALTEECLRQAFGHIGHAHAMLMGEGRHAS